MNDAPAPLVPAEVQFRDDKTVPVPYDCLSFGRFSMEQNTRVALAAMTLMLRSWHGKPAASFDDFGSRFWRVANETPAWWARNGDKVLAYFVKCSDGRFYSPEMAPIALKRWNSAVSGRQMDVSATEWVRLRAAVFARDGYRCIYCGMKDVALHADHVLALSRGGASTMENLVTACGGCNTSKGAKPVQEWLA